MKNMRYITICAGILLMLAACDKDKPETKPSIKIKSVNGSIVPVNGSLGVELEFADKEGDVDDSLFVRRIRLNTRGAIRGERLNDSFYLMVPKFTNKSNGEILLTLKYNLHLKDAIEAPKDAGKEIPDSVKFRFALQDKGGNTSDTVETEQIVILRN